MIQPKWGRSGKNGNERNGILKQSTTFYHSLPETQEKTKTNQWRIQLLLGEKEEDHYGMGHFKED